MVAPSSGAARMRKATLRNATARLLVLGDRQVGKSAAIVRYTTGRFIENYSPETGDWLYRHSLGFDAARNQLKQVELLEQRDVAFRTGATGELARELDSTTDEDGGQAARPGRRHNTGGVGGKQRNSLSSRVARDRQRDAELHERQELLGRLRWADAFVVVYALNSSQSFNKAIRYLNLIANEVNNQNNYQNHGSNNNSGSSNNSSGNSNSNNQQVCNAARKPILLLANKRDLERAAAGGRARRVSHSDGRLLAMRHQCLFAELSVCASARPIELALTSLVEAIPACELHTSRLEGGAEQLLGQTTQLVRWTPDEQQQQQQQLQLQQPIWSSLVRTRAPQQALSSTQQLVQSGCLARAARAQRRTLTPVSASLSSGSSSSAGSSCAPSALATTTTVASSSLAPAPAQLAQPLALARSSISSISSISSAGALSNGGGGGCGAPVNGAKSHLSARYASLKSSFRKASLAIVGSRSLAARVASNKPTGVSIVSPAASDADQQRRQPKASGPVRIEGGSGARAAANRANVSDSDGSPSCQRAHWMLRSKFGSLGRQQEASDTSSLGNQSLGGEPQAAASGRFRRPLFKYRTRRKTVAFEAPAGGGVAQADTRREVSSCQASRQLAESCCPLPASNAELAPRGSLGASDGALFELDVTGCGRASSELGVTEPGRAPSLQPPAAAAARLELDRSSACSENWSASSTSAQLAAPPDNRRESHSTASTSGGSCDEDSELEAARAAQPPGGARRAAYKSVVAVSAIQPLLEEASVARVYQAYCKKLIAW